MFCKSCGKEISNDAIFCPNCGQKVDVNVHPAGDMGRRSHSNVVAGFCKNPLSLVFAIFLSAYAVFGIAAYNRDIVGSTMSLISYFAIAFICVGCWIVYISSRRGDTNKLGFSIIRIGIPIMLVFIAISTIITVVYMRFYTYGASLAFTIIIYLAGLALTVWATVGVFFTTNDAFKILDGSGTEWRVYRSSVVIFIIVAVLSAVQIGSIISRIASFRAFYGSMVIMQLYSVRQVVLLCISSVVYILVSVILYKLRRHNI